MTKREKFEQLDELVLDAMISALDTTGGKTPKTDELRDLNVAVTYLKNNQVITPPKEEGTMGDKIKDILAE